MTLSPLTHSINWQSGLKKVPSMQFQSQPSLPFFRLSRCTIRWTVNFILFHNSKRCFQEVPSSSNLHHLTQGLFPNLAPCLSHFSFLSGSQPCCIFHCKAWTFSFVRPGTRSRFAATPSLSSPRREHLNTACATVRSMRRRQMTTPSLFPPRRKHQVEVVAHVLVQVGHQVVVVAKVQVHLVQ